MGRKAFTLVEALLTLGIVGVVTGVTVPLYREYQIHSDLDRSTEQAVQGLRRAKIIAQSGQDGSAWGFYVPHGVLYKGTSYASRDTSYDESYPMPSTIAVEGLYEVSYSPIVGAPSDIGTITLVALNRERRSIVIDIEPEGITTTASDKIAICHHADGSHQHTINIADNAWPAHHAHGDTYGPCAIENPPSSSSISSSSPTSSSVASSSTPVSSSVSSAASSTAGGGGASSSASTCSTPFSIANNGLLTTTARVDVDPAVLASNITYGIGGPAIGVEVLKSTNGGSTYSSFLSYANVKNLDATGHKLSNVAASTQIAFKGHGYYKKNGWLTFDQSRTTIDGSTRMQYLRNGDTVPAYIQFAGQQTLRQILQSKGYMNAQNVVTIPSNSVIFIGELNVFPLFIPLLADYQDIVVLLTFTCS